MGETEFHSAELSGIVTNYGSENDHQDYWDNIWKKYGTGEIVRAISVCLRSNDPKTVHSACIFAQHSIEHFGYATMPPDVIDQIEEIAAGENLKNAHTAVFVLGRIQSKKSVGRLKAILSSGKHRDPEFVRNLEVNIELLT